MPDEPSTGLSDLIPTAATVVGALVVLRLVKLVVDRHHKQGRNEPHFRGQVVLMALSLVAVIATVLTLPVDIATRGQLLNLIGILLTAVLALSSTTVMANMLAGLMLRSMRTFRPGDFVRVGESFGRVTLRGLFYTEVQTEQRDLIAMPNQYLISNPMTVVRASGTIVSTELSLGYDVHHARVEELLCQAAESAGLAEPFVHVRQLGDFAVTYRVSGFLEEVQRLVSARSRLSTAVLDALHEAGVEIVSPSFMNQRPLPPDEPVIPRADGRRVRRKVSADAEALVFDKAEGAQLATELETERERLREELGELPSGDDEGRATRKRRIEAIGAELERLKRETEDES